MTAATDTTTSSATQLVQRLGYFDAFMRAWGSADAATRDAVYQDTLAYRAGQITGPAEVADVSRLLGIAAPAA